MYLILRPAMPPFSLIRRKNASWHLAWTPSADTGPLREVVLPIRISVALTPGVSSARASRGEAKARVAAVEPASNDRRRKACCFGMVFPPRGRAPFDRAAVV